MWTIALRKYVEHRSLPKLHEKLFKIGAKAVQRGRYVIFRLAEAAIPDLLLAEVPCLIDHLHLLPLPSCWATIYKKYRWFVARNWETPGRAAFVTGIEGNSKIFSAVEPIGHPARTLVSRNRCSIRRWTNLIKRLPPYGGTTR